MSSLSNSSQSPTSSSVDPTLSATGSSASATATPAQPTGNGSNPFGGNSNNNNNNQGSTPLSVFPQKQHYFAAGHHTPSPSSPSRLVRRQDTAGNASIAPPSSSSASSSSSSSSSAPTASASGSGNSGGGGFGFWTGGTNFPVPFLAFAVVAIALFVVVVAFVLLRICMRNRRLRRMGIVPDGPFDRFLGGGPLGLREMEDTQVPPRLWEAKIVPIGAYGQQQQRDAQDMFPLWGAKSSSPSSYGWENLMPIAASLPSNLYSTTGAQKHLDASSSSNEKNAETAAAADQDPTERIPGSVNVSVFIAMPSPPKQDGEELPELMIGTAAVPIFSRPAASQAEGAVSALSPAGDEYFGSQRDAQGDPTASSTSNKFSHPTRAELLALYKAARDVKAAKVTKREEAAAAAKEAAAAASKAQEEAGGSGNANAGANAADETSTTATTSAAAGAAAGPPRASRESVRRAAV